MLRTSASAKVCLSLSHGSSGGPLGSEEFKQWRTAFAGRRLLLLSEACPDGSSIELWPKYDGRIVLGGESRRLIPHRVKEFFVGARCSMYLTVNFSF